MNIISLNEFHGNSDVELLRNAIKYLKENPGTQLTIPPRKYVLYDEDAHKLQQNIMNGELGNNTETIVFNKDFKYKIGLDFSGVSYATIEAYGVTLMVDGFMEPISLQNCDNIIVKGLTIDHVRKPYSKGKIVDFGTDHTDISFEGQTCITERMPSERISIIGRESKYIEKIFSSKEKIQISKNIIRFYGFSAKGHMGDEAYVWHTYHFRPAILIYESKDIKLIDVTINSQPGMGIVGHRSHNILLKGLKVVPSIGEKMSTNTDATHFTSCTGLLRFDGCHFEGQGDDSTNVHVYYHTIIKCKKNVCITAVQTPTHGAKLDYPNVGDILELSNRKDLIPVENYEVISVKPDFENWCCEIELDRNLPVDFEAYYLADTTTLPALEFVNCFVRNHLARGVLVKTRNVLIDNCMFEYNTGTAIHVAAEASWHEGVTTKNLVIRNNRIIGSGNQGYGEIFDTGGICINILSVNPISSVHKNILIENNIIDCENSKHAIFAGNVDGLKIVNNSLRSAREGNEIETTYCQNVVIENNITG